MRRSALKRLAATAAVGLLAPVTARAQSFPARPIRIVVPFPAGGPTDQVARLVATTMQAALGQNVLVDNRPGGGGQIGASQLQQSPADGYTLVIGDMGLLAANTSLYRKLSYDVQKDFVPVSAAMNAPMVLVVPAASPAASLGDLVARSKVAPLNFASQGNGTGGHLLGEQMRLQTKAAMNHVPYKGSAPALQDVIAGNVDLFWDVLGSVLPHVRAGRVKALAIATPKRANAAPEIPTTAEAGQPQLLMSPWFGFMVRSGTPDAVVARLNAELNAALRNPEVVAKLQGVGFEPIPGTPDALARLIREETDRWGAVVKAADIRID